MAGMISPPRHCVRTTTHQWRRLECWIGPFTACINDKSISGGEWRAAEARKVRGLHGLHGAGRDHPVVTRKDFDEAESPPRSTSLAAVMRPGGEFGYFDAKRNLLSLTDSPLAWPACLHGPARSLSLLRRDDHYLV